MKRQQLILAALFVVTSLILSIAIFSENCANFGEGFCDISQSVIPDRIEEPDIIVEIASSNTIADWTTAVAEQFNSERHTTVDGKVISVELVNSTSGEAQRAILDGTLQSDVWIPGDMSWVLAANEVWADRNGMPLVQESCTATIFAPIGLAMWQPMVEALGWPGPINIGTLIAISTSEEGWGLVGHPEWGSFKLGHTHPDYSDDGLLAMNFIAYRALEQTEGVTVEDIYNDLVFGALYTLEQNTYHYGIESRDLLDLMATRGPQYLHAVTTTEADTLRTNAELADDMRFPMVFVFPEFGTFWSEHPYCILDTEQVSDEKREAATIFLDYLLLPAQQELAMESYLRPLDPAIELVAPISLENGTNPEITTDIVPALEPPSAGVANAVRDVFHMTKKPATVIMVLDTSGSMEGAPIRDAAESGANFIGRLDPRDEIYVYGFSNDIVPIGQGGTVSELGDNLSDTVRGVIADGGTALYDAVCEAIEQIEILKQEHAEQGIQHLYGIVLLSDGDDQSSRRSENQMFECLPDGENVEEVKIYTIAYGNSANHDLLLRIANRTNGQFFTGDQQDIDQIYTAISAEQ